MNAYNYTVKGLPCSCQILKYTYKQNIFVDNMAVLGSKGGNRLKMD